MSADIGNSFALLSEPATTSQHQEHNIAAVTGHKKKKKKRHGAVTSPDAERGALTDRTAENADQVASMHLLIRSILASVNNNDISYVS
jgi:hypothetical protein